MAFRHSFLGLVLRCFQTHYSVAKLFNLSLATAVVPSQWKGASITPVPKVTHPAELSDYPPIFINYVLSRVKKRIIVRSYIDPAFNSPPPSMHLSDKFAFRPTGFTTAALITLLQIIASVLADSTYVRVIALDIKT